jgi:hypothetical protein
MDRIPSCFIIDESGAPGVAAHSNDFLAVNLVIFQMEIRI